MKTYQWLVSTVFIAGVAAVSGCKKQAATGADAGSPAAAAESGYQFENGYPSRETAEKLYDEMDYQRATQAYLWALPAVGYKALYDAQSKTFGAANGDVVFYRDLKDKAGMLTPNITTLYAFSFWDLAKQGPMVVDVPAGLTAGGVMDIWQQPITDMGQTGPDKGSGGKYLILPPGSEPMTAAGYYVVQSPSNQVWFGTRGLDPDKAVAEATVRKHRIYSWNQRDKAPETKYLEVAGKDWQSAQPNTLEYWRLLAELYANEPVAPRDRMMFGMLKALGISPGQAFKPDARQARILTEAAKTGDLMARTIAYEKRFEGATVYPGKQWEYAVKFDLNQEDPEQTRVQFDERASWFYEAIGMSAGMQGRIVGFGQVYLETSKDKDGNWLDGGKTYKMRVEPNPPVRQFWSITLYDNLTRGPLITDQGAADLSSRKPDLVTNADGSVDVYFGPERPDGATNWIKTTAGKGWFPYFRFYAATEPYFDKSWQLNDIERVN
ncbi:MAG: DUF1254 domain-containing protein [Arenimonas sp.]